MLALVMFSQRASANSGDISVRCSESGSTHMIEESRKKDICAGEAVIATTLLEGEVLFSSNEYWLTKDGEQAVLKLIADLENYLDILSIKVVGHTDSRGSEEFNQQLSERRAVYIAHFFKKALPTQKTTAVGLGELQPIATNDTAIGRKKNRRVAIEVVANGVR